MRVELHIMIDSKDEKVVAELEELVKEVRCGSIQRQLEKDHRSATSKNARVKATVDVTY